jgi:hypothetical protein
LIGGVDVNAEPPDATQDNVREDYGVGRDYLGTLPSGAAVAYRGEPTAVELALLRYRLDEQGRQRFGESIERFMADLGQRTAPPLEALNVTDATPQASGQPAPAIVAPVEVEHVPSSQDGSPPNLRGRRRGRGGAGPSSPLLAAFVVMISSLMQLGRRWNPERTGSEI